MGAVLAAIFVVPGRVSESPRVSGEVVLESMVDPGADPFTDSVVTGGAAGSGGAPRPASPGGAPSASGSPTSSATASGATVIRSVTGSDPGLFGGTMRVASCDAHKLTAALTADAAKQRAWAGVVGVAPAKLADYVATLTSVVLREDTRATDHDYSGAAATDLQSVLQAGSAVLVDGLGVPRVRCRSGNPLSAAAAVSGRTTYVGSRWPGFQPGMLVVVVAAPKKVDAFVLIDLATGGRFSRPAAGDGSTDGAAPVGG